MHGKVRNQSKKSLHQFRDCYPNFSETENHIILQLSKYVRFDDQVNYNRLVSE